MDKHPRDITNPRIAARDIIKSSREKRAFFASVLTLTLVSASVALLWINIGVLRA